MKGKTTVTLLHLVWSSWLVEQQIFKEHNRKNVLYRVHFSDGELAYYMFDPTRAYDGAVFLES